MLRQNNRQRYSSSFPWSLIRRVSWIRRSASDSAFSSIGERPHLFKIDSQSWCSTNIAGILTCSLNHKYVMGIKINKYYYEKSYQAAILSSWPNRSPLSLSAPGMQLWLNTLDLQWPLSTITHAIAPDAYNIMNDWWNRLKTKLEIKYLRWTNFVNKWNPAALKNSNSVEHVNPIADEYSIRQIGISSYWVGPNSLSRDNQMWTKIGAPTRNHQKLSNYHYSNIRNKLSRYNTTDIILPLCHFVQDLLFVLQYW